MSLASLIKKSLPATQLPGRRLLPLSTIWPVWANDAGTTWPVANDALIIPFEMDQDATLAKAHVMVVTSSGNIDVGIYNGAGTTKIGSVGSTAMGSAGDQSFTLGYALAKGRYLCAVACSSATASLAMQKVNPGALAAGRAYSLLGFYKQATALPLPSTLTLATTTADAMPMVSLEFS